MKKIIIILCILIIIFINAFLLSKINDNPIIKTVKKVEEIIENSIYKEYKIGDIIKLNNEEWYVIEDSDKDKDYITLINTNYNRKIKDCFNKYIYLNEKNYFEGEYSKSIGIDKLKEVNDYYIRLITLEEYNKLAELTKKEIDEIKYSYTTKPSYTWVKEINTLSMTDIDFYDDIEDKTNLCASWYIQSNIRQVFSIKDDFINIQPVINYLKDYII